MLAPDRSIMDGSAKPPMNLAAVKRFWTLTLLVLVSTVIFFADTDPWIRSGPPLVVLLLAGGLAIDGVTSAQIRLVKIRRDDPVQVGVSRDDDVRGA